MNNGAEIVLTADRTLLTTYGNNLYIGLAASLPTNVCPDSIYYSLLCPPVPSNPDGTVSMATPAIATAEAIMVHRAGIPKEKIKIAHPDFLDLVINKNTKIVAVSTMDPLGLGPSTTTWSTLFSGIPHTRAEFLRLMLGILRPLKEKYHFKIVVGGPGAWQVTKATVKEKLGIDYLMLGESEYTIPKVFPALLESGEYEKDVIEGSIVKPEDVPSVLTPSVFGLVEIARGCGRGCRFCVPATSGRMRMMPMEKILDDIKVHIDAGYDSITFHSDDALRYGSKDFLIDEDALFTLYKEGFKLGAREIFITHSTLAPFVKQSDVIERLTKLLRKHGHKYYGCQPGIETASSRLMEIHMKGKALPYDTSEWASVIKRAHKVMWKNRWLSVDTLMMGLPGEENEDVLETIQLIKDLKDFPSLFVPLFFVPMEYTTLKDMTAFISNYMSEAHWRLLLTCWKHNARYIEPLYQLTTESHSIKDRIGITILTRLMSFFLNQKEKQLDGKSMLMNSLSYIFSHKLKRSTTSETKLIKKAYS
ncbi:MAG: B12-binding domain-containing radical SAM protein [Candidatus Odinarchaeia archaeon]